MEIAENVSKDEIGQKRLYDFALYLSLFTIVYNIAEGVISTLVGYSDESLTLFGFGVDSFIETISGIGIAAMVIRIANNPKSSKSPFEITALQITGWSFYLLSGGLLLSAVFSIIYGQQPESTFWGVVISLVSIACMLGLIHYKRKVGNQLNSKAMIADANCNVVCVYMSLTLLASSFLFETFSVPYVDAAGAVGLVYFSVKEGRECFEKAESMNDTCSCEHD
ncbi:MAG: cation transporter [Ignavibacteriales bacterium]|nr:cation transporter [Ignavibacteriales bacterium]